MLAAGPGQSPEFQSTHLREVRRDETARIVKMIEFQSTHLREVRRSKLNAGISVFVFQSTHLREVRQNYCKILSNRSHISIHAPT